ncbi:helix-turn-helix domain-containing protein [Pseudoduganella ginsengisoli]|uniref:Transcriptional regulator n=1 Tax=Pseudoduganella ginsengisoli TaxID=1462440 RepID=A0A6L6Q6I6_9BURK|nr:helix-turn-helix domain-containing protein [Pseudoduganella ginsengisoli]MTW05049.1 transcriptional regulator [Pseudoduganella ginsengisoli]
MKHTDFGRMPCPIARSLGKVGEWWSILILRDAFYGLTRFDEFEKSLKIAPNMLTRRLAGLVEGGLMEKRQYSTRPPRYEYVLTKAGRDFKPVLLAFIAWGNEHLAPEGASLLVVSRETGKPADQVLVDARTGLAINDEDYMFAAGPAANEMMKMRLEDMGRRGVQ